MKKLSELIGYFDHPDQLEPTYDPPHAGPCVVCGQSLTEPVKTISLMYADEELPRAYFYRVHKICYEEDPAKADGIVWDFIHNRAK